MAERCRQKRNVQLSAVFVTVRFWIVFRCGVKLIVVGENAELNFALSAVYSVFREEAELCVFGEYVE